jgi:hypothetical protein
MAKDLLLMFIEAQFQLEAHRDRLRKELRAVVPDFPLSI